MSADGQNVVTECQPKCQNVTILAPIVVAKKSNYFFLGGCVGDGKRLDIYVQSWTFLAFRGERGPERGRPPLKQQKMLSTVLLPSGCRPSGQIAVFVPAHFGSILASKKRPKTKPGKSSLQCSKMASK